MTADVGQLVAVCTVHEVRPDPGMKGRTAIDKRPRSGAVSVGADALAGDIIADEVNHGGRDQAVYAYAQEEADRWAAELGPAVGPGWFGENLTVTGIAVTDAVIGERWCIGGDRPDATVLEVTLPRTPCATFGRWPSSRTGSNGSPSAVTWARTCGWCRRARCVLAIRCGC